MRAADEIIAALDLAPHPEGGWYRQTWAAPAGIDGRSAATSILFLLAPGQASHWHRIDAAELWIFQAGAPLILSLAAGEAGEGGVRQVSLGPDPVAGHGLQQIVEPRQWQAARAPDDGWSLVACLVVPGFQFNGFELAAPDWRPGG